jgi:hypothetical protein
MLITLQVPSRKKIEDTQSIEQETQATGTDENSASPASPTPPSSSVIHLDLPSRVFHFHEEKIHDLYPNRVQSIPRNVAVAIFNSGDEKTGCECGKKINDKIVSTAAG